MLKLPRFRLLLAGSILLTILNQSFAAQLEQLANRVPETANSLVVINVKAAYASRLARAQNWKQQGLEAHQAGITAIPSGADDVLMAAEIDFELMKPQWEIAVARVQQVPAMQDIAARSGGRLDRLAGVRAVERPNDSFVVNLGPKLIGAMSPANRQQVIRWVRKSQRRQSPELSPYLGEALQVAERSDNQIVLALDLHGIFAAAEIAANLDNKQDLIKDEQDNIDTLSQAIASIRGIRLEVELANPAQGRLAIDFAQDVALLQNVAKPLLLNVLADHGAKIDDLEDWQAKVDGKSIELSGELSQSGLRRVLSVLSSPVGPMAAPAGAGSTSDDIADASQRYFQSVIHYLDDLFVSDFQPQSLFQARTWVERYARKIGDLDAHQVDPDVVAFAGSVQDYLNEIVSVVDRTQKRTDLREVTLYQAGQRRFNRYGAFGGYVEKPYVARDRAIAQADESNQGLIQVDAIVRDLRAISAQTRKTMTDRYGRQF